MNRSMSHQNGQRLIIVNQDDFCSNTLVDCFFLLIDCHDCNGNINFKCKAKNLIINPKLDILLIITDFKNKSISFCKPASWQSDERMPKNIELHQELLFFSPIFHNKTVNFYWAAFTGWKFIWIIQDPNTPTRTLITSRLSLNTFHIK